MRSESEVRQELRLWIFKVSKKLTPETQAIFADSTSLMDSRIITSLQIMELILVIEKLRGQKFDLKKLKPGAFNSINSIYATFFTENKV